MSCESMRGNMSRGLIGVGRGVGGVRTTPFGKKSLKLTVKFRSPESFLLNWPWKSGIFDNTTPLQKTTPLQILATPMGLVE
jgi:hypothetical protein